MGTKLDAFYLKRDTFKISAVIACIGWMAWGVAEALGGNLEMGLSSIVFTILLVLLVVAYKLGETNVQKMLLGGILTGLFVMYVKPLADHITNGNIPASVYYSICCALVLIVFIAHMVQQTDHSGASESIAVSQCSGLLIVVLLVWDIYLGVTGGLTILELFWTICITATVVFIVSMETRIKEYKRIRTEKKAVGGWTEEERQKAKMLFKL